MKTPRSVTGRASRELAKLRARLAEAESTLQAIRLGEVDAVVVAAKNGPRVFTLEGAEHAYRVLVESMNEGAMMLAADNTILYANRCFARIAGCPLEQVAGGSLRRFLAAEDLAMLKPLLKGTGKSGSKMLARLQTGDGVQRPVHLSIRLLAQNGSYGPTFGLVVTDMTEVRRTEELLRAWTHRVVQVQEAERGRVALELHDHITQLLCGVLVRSQSLANQLSGGDGPAKREAMKLCTMLGQTADEVERISRNLRPSVLDELGLVSVLHDAGTDFAERTGLSVNVACSPIPTRLPAATELTLFRILQEALKNVEKHARAGRVAVRLTCLGATVQLTVNDDGIGFDVKRCLARRDGMSGLGLLGMRERAAYVGGTLTIRSSPRAGTEIEVRIPLGRPGAGRENLLPGAPDFRSGPPQRGLRGIGSTARSRSKRIRSEK